MSFKNFYLTEAGEVDTNAQQQKPVDKEQPQQSQQAEKPNANKEQSPQNKPPEKKNNSLFGGKLYSGVSKFSKNLTKVGEFLIKNFDKVIDSIEKKGDAGKKLATGIKTMVNGAKEFKEKHPATYSFIMNMAAGAAGAAAGQVVGAEVANAINLNEYKTAIKEIEELNKAIADKKEVTSTKGGEHSSSFGSSSSTIKHSRTTESEYGSMTPEQRQRVDQLYEEGKINIRYTETIRDNSSSESGNLVSTRDGQKIGTYSDKTTDITSTKSDYSLKSNITLQTVSALASPSPSVLGSIALQSVLNALDKVDKRQMPASKYIATVVNKVKDEKKKKEMLAAFIRMRSKQI